MATTFQYWSLTPPARWQAGTVGAEQTPFYFDCADCGAKEPEIAGIISTDGTFGGIGVVKVNGGPFMNPAMFCASCWSVRMFAAGNRPAGHGEPAARIPGAAVQS